MAITGQWTRTHCPLLISFSRVGRNCTISGSKKADLSRPLHVKIGHKSCFAKMPSRPVRIRTTMPCSRARRTACSIRSRHQIPKSSIDCANLPLLLSSVPPTVQTADPPRPVRVSIRFPITRCGAAFAMMAAFSRFHPSIILNHSARCLLTPFSCTNSSYHPECTHVPLLPFPHS